MIESGRISSFQMGLMLYSTVATTLVLLVPATAARFAEQDLWLSPIWASAAGFLTVYLVYRLNIHYPQASIIQSSEAILGRFGGKIIGLVYFFFFMHTTGLTFREYGEFIAGTVLQQTPITIVIGSMALLSAFAVRGGLEVMARSAQFLVPIAVSFFYIIVLLLLPDAETDNLFPVLEKGIVPSLLGAVAPMGWFGEVIAMSFLLPFVKDRGKGFKWGTIAVVAIMLTMVISNLITWLLFGTITGSLTYPVMSAARYIGIADFLEHLEALVMAIWVVGMFVKLSVFYYICVLVTAQWFNLSDYRPFVLPTGLLLVGLSVWSAANLQEIEWAIATWFPFYDISMHTMIPLILLGIALVRRRLRGQDNRRGETT